jgi:hypothetical protein
VESAPRAYRLKVSNAAPSISTSGGTIPGKADYNDTEIKSLTGDRYKIEIGASIVLAESQNYPVGDIKDTVSEFWDREKRSVNTSRLYQEADILNDFLWEQRKDTSLGAINNRFPFSPSERESYSPVELSLYLAAFDESPNKEVAAIIPLNQAPKGKLAFSY